MFIRKAPAVTIDTLVQAIQELTQTDNKIKIIGTRHGEKLYEVLVTREEMVRAEEMDNYFRIKLDNRNLNYENYAVKGEVKTASLNDYTSHNTIRLNVEEMKKLLLKLDLFQQVL